MSTVDLVALGSQTAKNGFANEDFVRDEFNSWRTSKLAQEWLVEMGYNLQKIEYVRAEKVGGSYKTDVQVIVRIKLKNILDTQNLQVKLVSNKENGFNQIDKHWVDQYVEMWSIPDDVADTLKYYTGEKLPYRGGTRDSRRMFLDEMTDRQRFRLLAFLREKKILIITDIIKGRGKLCAEWVLVILRDGLMIEWCLKPINVAMDYYGGGDVELTSRGNVKIGRITMQRKGGDGGRASANMLQFKANPLGLFDI